MVNRWYLYFCVYILMLYLFGDNSNESEVRLHWKHDLAKATAVVAVLLAHPALMDLMNREDFTKEGLELEKRMARHWGGMTAIALCAHGGVYLGLQYWK